MKPHRLEKLFNPQSVAVLGASDDISSVGGRVFKNLVGGLAGPVIPVNPSHKTVGGRECFASVRDIEAAPELAVIATPARTVVGAIRECGEKGIGAAIILSAGFNETGEAGARLEAELADAARHADIRFVGPNCLGVMRPAHDFNATFLGEAPPRGRLALVSQSGALCAAITDWAGAAPSRLLHHRLARQRHRRRFRRRARLSRERRRSPTRSCSTSRASRMRAPSPAGSGSRRARSRSSC